MKIGFIGLGRMGWGMAATLAGAGHELTVWNRTTARAEEFAQQNNAHLAYSPDEVAQATELIITMLADPRAVRQVAAGPDGLFEGVRTDQLWIDASTVDPQTSRELAIEAARHGLRMLDAPVLGSVPEANAGKLLMMVGGAEKDLEEARPVLDHLAHKIFYLGDHGQGAQMKLVINSLLGGFLEVISEALALGVKGGIRPEMLQQVIGSTALASPWVNGKLTRVFEEHGAVHFTLPMMLKDLELIGENGRQVGAEIPALEGARQEFAQAAQTDLADRDYTEIFTFILNQTPNRRDDPEH